MASLLRTKASIEFQRRDLEVLRGLFESRVMTLAHIAALFFDGKREAAKKRLQKMKTAGFVGERNRRVYEPSVLYLAPRAFEVLRMNGVLSEYPPFALSSLERRAAVSEVTIRHELQV